MKITITHHDANSKVVLDVSVAGQYFGELEPGKSITVTGPQVAISHGRFVAEDAEPEVA